MKKYIFAFLTFFIGFFLIAVFQVLVFESLFISMILFTVLLLVSMRVYKKFKAMEPELDSELNPYRLTDTEKQSFEKVFKELNSEELRIKEIIVGSARKNKIDYAIVLRTENGLFKHADMIRKGISTEFGNGKKFEIFLNAREEELEQYMKSVHRINNRTDISEQ